MPAFEKALERLNLPPREIHSVAIVIVPFIYILGNSRLLMYHGRTAPFAITLAVLMLTIVPVFTQFSPIHTVAATKRQPPPSSTSATWAKAYNIPYSYSVAESIAQTSSGGYVVGASCTAAAVTTPNCNTLSEPTAMVMRVDPSGNIQSQTQ